MFSLQASTSALLQVPPLPRSTRRAGIPCWAAQLYSPSLANDCTKKVRDRAFPAWRDTDFTLSPASTGKNAKGSMVS